MNTTPPNTKHCGQCKHFDKSKLDGYGYCESARTMDLRARLLHRDTVCLFLNEWSAP